MSRLFALLLAGVVLVSGVAPAVAGSDSGATVQATVGSAGESPTRSTAGSDDDAARQATTPPDDPASDVVGWEAGYWHDEPIDVDQSDGLSDAELEAYVARAMARVEYIREAEFERSVPVSVISREEYRERSGGGENDSAFGAWNNQVWEALFIVGEDRDVQTELSDTYGTSVAGFYSPRDDEIKIITSSPDSPVVDNATLVHELTHALQDQTHNLTDSTYRSETQDGDLAIDGLVEGEANLVEQLYAARCGAEWECVSSPVGEGGSSGSQPNLGVLLTLLQPYSDGPVYVDNLRQEGGWSAVDAAFRSPPASTEQVIHLTDEDPRPIDFEDRATDGWETFPNQGQGGSDTVGEASIFAMFWYQSRTAGADAVDPRSVGRTSSQFDLYNYDATPSAGWANDRVFPYRRPGANGTAYGYVWVTEWDTETDAREFVTAYRSVLRAQDAARSEGVNVVEEGPFADAFLVSRQGTRVTVVNGPTPAAVRAIRPGLEGSEPTDGATGVKAPGFGLSVALAALALLAAVLASVRRRR